MINRLMGRLAHLNEPQNKKHEDHLRKIITKTIERAEQIASQKTDGRATFTQQVSKRSRTTLTPDYRQKT
jgi:hypothetical protein